MTKRVRVFAPLLSVLLLLGASALDGAGAAPASLGTARGNLSVSFDDGKTWMPPGPTSFPIMDGSQIRTRSGSAALELSNGSRVTVLPFGRVQVRNAGTAPEVTLVHGRVTFRLAERSPITLATAVARLEPSEGAVAAGEVFVDPDGTTGVKLSQGSLAVRELVEPYRVLVAGSEPVFLPKRPDVEGPLFGADVSQTPPAGATAAFGPTGESLGYVGPDGRLVVKPGYTADLLRPFPAKLTRSALTTIPESQRAEATPIFGVNGRFLGHQVGSGFSSRSTAAAPSSSQSQQGSVVESSAKANAPSSFVVDQPGGRKDLCDNDRANPPATPNRPKGFTRELPCGNPFRK